jgi:DNA-binding transcriptional regulator YiaG
MSAYHYLQCGLDSVWLLNGFEIVQTKYGESVRIDRADELDAVIAASLTEKAAPLTGAEFRFLRQQLDMSQKRIGELMGKEAQTVAIWEKSPELNRDVDFLIRHIYRQAILDERQTYVEMVDRLNHLDRVENAGRLKFQETPEGWLRSA